VIDHVTESDVAEVLFGDEVLTCLVEPDGPVGEPKTARRPNGLWYGQGRERYKHVAGVLIVSNLVPWNVAEKTPCMYHNPWSSYAIQPEALAIPSYVAAASGYEKLAGQTGSEVFKLPSDGL
jgi:hypothetical protein